MQDCGADPAREPAASAGLGVARCRRLVAGMGGWLAASSDPGRCSVLRFAIPTGRIEKVAVVSAADPKPESVASLVGCRVLLAEDGPDNRKLIELLLKREGIELVSVENGRAALERVAEAELDGLLFDVIPMDMHMPLLDGFEATERREGCLAAGCDDFLTKPIDRARLIATIARFARDSKRL